MNNAARRVGVFLLIAIMGAVLIALLIGTLLTITGGLLWAYSIGSVVMFVLIAIGGLGVLFAAAAFLMWGRV